MKKLIHILLFLVVSITLKAQIYSNEWINFSNKYFKFPIYQTGFYRIDSLTLASAGVPVSFINPQNLQLFIKGQEQKIYVQGEGDNVFDKNDFVEFYAEKNDGRFDSTLYYNITYQPNPFVGLTTDTIYGYITWNNSTTNKRLVIETDTASALQTPAAYFYNEKIYTGNDNYNYVQNLNSGASDPRYTQMEGLGRGITEGNQINCSFGYLGMYTTTPTPAYLRYVLSGASVDNSYPQDHELKGFYKNNLNNNITLFDTLFSGYKPFRYTYTIQSNNLSSSSDFSILSVSNPIFAGNQNFSVVHYIYLKYPQEPDLSAAYFSKLIVDDDMSNPKTYLKLVGVNTGTNNSVLFYDVTNGKRIVTKLDPIYTKILVPNSGGQKLCYLSAEQKVIPITKLYPVNQTGFFVNYKATMADSAFVIISHKSLMVDANNYKAYRQSAAGGSRDVILADVDDLYDQFAYGIQKHPLAIRHFMRFLIDSLPTKPSYLFLLGKSVQNEELRNNNNTWNRCLVPTMGVPPADNLLTSGLTNNMTLIPEIPVGRLSAQNTTDVSWYLTKVQQHESAPPADWKKHVLHFAGGADLSEITTIKNFEAGYRSIIEDSLYGGKVYNFEKNTTAPIQITLSDSVKGLINYGASLITFFGHGSYQGFDQAIDDPNAYSNAGKYPMMLANSCYSGNFHTYGLQSSAERFVIINQKGTIGFLAATSLGFVSQLNTYSSAFYQALGRTKYNRGIGDVIKEACKQTSIFTGDPILDLTVMEMSLQGDPAVVVSPGRLPDYFINNSSVSFDTKKYVDSIGILIDITNLGKAIHDSMFVRVERTFANNDSVTYFKYIKAPIFKDTLKFYMLTDYVRGIGLNKFKVKVDVYNGIAELNENNNSTTGTVDLFIQGGDIIPVYPYKYDIIPNTPTVTLKASTSDPFTKTRNYRFQLDTCDAFTSPIQTAFINSAGGVVEWTVNLPFADSTVYYWRVTKDSISPTETFVWRESSFQVIGNKHGWGQSHFFQFKNDGYQFVKFKRPQRRFEFLNDVTSIDVRTGFLSALAYDQITYSINNSITHVWNCSWNGWTVAVFDSISGKPWVANPTTTVGASCGVFGIYGNCNCVSSTQPLYAFDFGVNNYCCAASPWQTDLENFLKNIVPVNNYVLAYSAQFHQSSTYSPSLITEFQKIGSANISTVKDTTSMIIFGRKKNTPSPGSAHEVVGTTSLSIVTLADSITTRWHSGYIASEIIGPSFKWNSLHWKIGTIDVGAGDTTILKVIGIKNNGQRDTLVTFTKDSLNVLDLYNYADAATYPFMQLVAFMKDKVNNTSPQLKRWQVLYDESPECAINPKKGFKVTNDTLQEGDKVTFYIPVENIGTLPFTDSLVFTYWIEDANRVNHYLPQKLKAKPFNPGAVIMDTIKISSYQYPGSNALWIDVNPTTNVKYQQEQYHFNNVARYGFSVSRDVTNPLLDVTFDGVRIMNGDIVSAKPNILVSLKDENKFLALNDTSAFAVYLKKPTDAIEQRIYFSNGLQFTPASLPNNSCKINFAPVLPTDGKYTLIVQARDRSNNQSGAVDYRITFDVINRSTITQIINYPNPFSTSTRFVFNLTGSEIPEMFNIQIMTITGKIVKTIMKEELGPMHIGRNITQYAWDGKDDFGDRLGNGVYLYKVQTKLNGQTIEHQASGADQFFTKEIGKMVIMR